MNNSWATIELDYAALLHNVGVVKQHAPHSKILAMVKANAYGHGLAKIATAITDHVDGFGVARLTEVKELRDAGIKLPIVLMAGVISESELKFAEALQADLVVHQLFQIELLQLLSSPINVWLKLDTGMGRLGFNIDEFQCVLKSLEQNKRVSDIKIMSHFSDSGCPNLPKTAEQMNRFYDSVQACSYEKSLANSAAVLTLPASHADWVRPGLMLYGASPISKKHGDELGLKPVMTFSSIVIAIKKLRAGDTVGYESIYTCPSDMNVAVVAVGYGDSYPRHIQENTPVLIGGVQCPIIGRISMDMMMIDVSQLPIVEIGEKVILWGTGLLVDEISNYAETSSYELLTQIFPRN